MPIEAPLAAEKNPKFFYGYVIVIAAFLVIAVQMGSLNSFGVFLEPVLDEFGWTRAMTSGAFSLAYILMIFFQLVAGRLNDRLGPRRLLTFSGIVSGAGYALMSQVNTGWQLYLFYGVIVSLGFSASFIPLISTVTRWFVRRRSTMTGIVLTSIGVGTMLMPVLAGWLITSYDWRTSFVGIGALALAVTVMAGQFLKRDPQSMGLSPYGADAVTHNAPHQVDKGFTVAEAIRTRRLWILAATFFCLGFPVYAILVHIVIYATGLGIPDIRAVSIVSIIGGLNIAGRLFMGNTADRIGNRQTMMASMGVMLASLIWLQFANQLWMLYLFAVVFGFTYSVTLLESPMVAELFGIKAHGTLLGVVDGGLTLGGVVGPVLAGYIYDVTGSYQIGFMACAVVAALGLVLAWLTRSNGK
ncbi:MAG: MFS transporter [Chloroflexi bacterium]|nr:MFS transporter [Chloroflexota bacterium]